VSAEENKAVVRRFIEEVWNEHNQSIIDEVVAPDYLNHAAPPEHPRGITGAKHTLYWLMATFPDTRLDIEGIIADGDMVAIRGTNSGTHEGEFAGILPTGKHYAVQHMHWFRVAEGKIAEHWAVRDDLCMRQQLGGVHT
jgi:predicted ester cyclase